MLALITALRAAFGSARLAGALIVVIVGVLNAAAPVILGWVGIVPDEAMLARINELALWIGGAIVAWIIGDSIRPTPGPTVKVLVLLAVCLAVGGSALAEDVVIAGDGQKSVTRYFRIDYDAAGVATVVPLAKVVRFGGPVPPVDPPTTPPLNPVAAEIKRLTDAALARGGTKNTGARISAVYGLVASSVNDGSIPHGSALAAVKLGTDTALLNQADAAAWAAWRDEVGNQLAKLQQDGSLATKAQYVGVLRDIEAGLNASTGFPGAAIAATLPPGQGILDGIDIAKIIELIKLLLELFKIFKPA